MEHLLSNNIISQSPQGGIQGRSSTILNIDIQKYMKQLIQSRQHGAIIPLDQSAAYDVVDPTILRKKLLHININKNDVNMIINYLTNRKHTPQSTQINQGN